MGKQEARWNERDEIQRLDFVAGVVAPTSLAGAVACAALIATGNLAKGSVIALGATGLVLLGCASGAILSLAWSPLEATEAGKSLDGVIKTKRSRTNKALGVLVISVLLGFGGTATIQLEDNGNSEAHHGSSAHGSGAHR